MQKGRRVQITCWGSRGSLPVSGDGCLRYGGDTTCLEIRPASGETVIVDAGSGLRPLGHRLARRPAGTIHFLFTHQHWDHLMGFPYFKPLYRHGTHCRVHGSPFCPRPLAEVLEGIMSPPNFPVRYGDLSARITFSEAGGAGRAAPAPFAIGSMAVEAIPLSHPDGGSGYRFSEKGRAFVFLTDNELGHRHPGGLTLEGYAERTRGADLLIHDAQWTPSEYRQRRAWGHSTYTQAMALARAAGVRQLGLFHLSPERSDSAQDAIVAEGRRRLDGWRHPPQLFTVAAGMRFSL
jgi:phosphoribosyl 1,2-cyclic phosphodiesterase